jgi:Flp pilus assembly CpaE family ATPase
MTLENFNVKVNQQKELEIIEDNLIEVLKFYVLITGIKELSFFRYEYEYNNFKYDFTVDETAKCSLKDDTVEHFNKKYSVILEESDGTIYGLLAFDNDPLSSEIINKVFEKIKHILFKRARVIKEFSNQEKTLDIYIITDQHSTSFASKLENSLNVLLNANVKTKTTIVSINEQLKDNITKSIIIYTVDDIELLSSETNILKSLNEFIFVIGPSDYNLSLYCGHLNVFKYISKDEFLPEVLKSFIVETQNKVQNKYLNKNKIISISGISGGIGTTTVAMNVANILAKRNRNKNVLFIDISTTKAISNLFLEQNPLPKKTIIDLLNTNEYLIEKNLENGLVKIRENFYAITGIQKQIDGDLLEQDIFIEKFLDYISKASEDFNFIIIDTGEANATALNTTIYDISNNLWLLTEMSLPHISKLKTFFMLMKRAGLKDKLSFLVNRYDSVNAISVSDVASILNTANEDHLNFDFKIPNDYQTLGHCWNYCELVSDSDPKSNFVRRLESILAKLHLIHDEEIEIIEKKKSFFSFLSFFNTRDKE